MKLTVISVEALTKDSRSLRITSNSDAQKDFFTRKLKFNFDAKGEINSAPFQAFKFLYDTQWLLSNRIQNNKT